MTTDVPADRRPPTGPSRSPAEPAGPEPGPTDAGPTLAHRAALAFDAYRGGDRQRLAELVDLLTPLLWHTVRAQRVPYDVAEDVVQTTWLRLVHGAAAIHDPAAVLAWLVTTAKRESWRVVRDARRTQALPDEQERDELADESGPGPEARALAGLDGQVLWQHVRALPERCRSLLRVIAFSDRPDYATVAQALGMPIGSIGPTRGRCLAKLRHLLDTDPHWGDLR